MLIHETWKPFTSQIGLFRLLLKQNFKERQAFYEFRLFHQRVKSVEILCFGFWGGKVFHLIIFKRFVCLFKPYFDRKEENKLNQVKQYETK